MLGVMECALGNAGFGILSAVIVELMIALAFLRIELMTPYRTRVTDLSANGEGERRVPNTAADVVQNSKSAVQVAGAYFCDVYQIGMPRSNRTALQVYLDVVSQPPLWVNVLMDLRNFLGKTVFGLKDLGRLDTLGQVSASNQIREGAHRRFHLAPTDRQRSVAGGFRQTLDRCAVNDEGDSRVSGCHYRHHRGSCEQHLGAYLHDVRGPSAQNHRLHVAEAGFPKSEQFFSQGLGRDKILEVLTVELTSFKASLKKYRQNATEAH